MKPTRTSRFASMIHEVGVPEALVRIVEARGADYIAARNPTTGLFPVRVPRGDLAPWWLRVDDAGDCVEVETISQTRQPAPMGWPVAGQTEAAKAA